MAQFIADFPSTLGNDVSAGQHYMIIDSFESKNAISTGETKLSSIGLYIPAGSLNTSFTGNYEGKEGAASAAAKSGAITGGTGFIDSMAKFASSVGQSVVQSALTAADSGGFVSASGLSPNNHMALVYKGPNSFRQHTFAFKFFPKNSSDSETVRAIIEEFRRGTLPRMSNGGGYGLKDSFFKSPRHHKITFCKGGSGADFPGGRNTHLFKIGTSVITNMQINFDPQSTVGFHSDGVPVQTDLTLTFQEIELQISPDNITGQDIQGLADAVSQNQSSSQTTSEQQAAQRDANLAGLGGQNGVDPKLG